MPERLQGDMAEIVDSNDAEFSLFTLFLPESGAAPFGGLRIGTDQDVAK